MGWFSRKPQVIKQCPDGAIHAYKDYKGDLHTTKEDADNVKIQDDKRRRRKHALNELERYFTMGRGDFIANQHFSKSTGLGYSFDQIEHYNRINHPAMFAKGRMINSKELAECLMCDWNFIKKHVETIIENS